MAKVKSIYKYRGKIFRYDYKEGIVSMLYRATEEERRDNTEWQAKYGRNLWEIDEDGYCEIESVGLRLENWEDREARNGYLDGWIDDHEEELAYMAKSIANEFA